MVGTNSSSDAQFEVLGLKIISIRITINAQAQMIIYLLNEVTRQVPTPHDKYIFNRYHNNRKALPRVEWRRDEHFSLT